MSDCLYPRALAGHAASSLDELLTRPDPIDCDPGLVPPDLADEEALLADALEARGARVVPSRSVRARHLTAALARLRRLS